MIQILDKRPLIEIRPAVPDVPIQYTTSTYVVPQPVQTNSKFRFTYKQPNNP